MSKRLQPSNNSPIILAIQAEAKRLGLTSYRLAKQTGLRIYTMQRLLAGTGSPTLSTLEAVAMALGMVLKLERPKSSPNTEHGSRR